MSTREVTREELGERWPLKVDHGKLIRDGSAVIFEAPNGKRYALNGIATSRGYKDIKPIHRKVSRRPDALRVHLKPLRDLA